MIKDTAPVDRSGEAGQTAQQAGPEGRERGAEGRRPTPSAPPPSNPERLREALAALSNIIGETLDKDFGFWSAHAQNERRAKLYSAWETALGVLNPPLASTSPDGAGEDAALIQSLRDQARRESEASRMLAEAKTVRQTDRGDTPGLEAGYSWTQPEQTVSWKAADRIASLSPPVDVAELRTIISGLADVLEQDCGCPPCEGSMAPGEHYLGMARRVLSSSPASLSPPVDAEGLFAPNANKAGPVDVEGLVEAGMTALRREYVNIGTMGTNDLRIACRAGVKQALSALRHQPARTEGKEGRLLASVREQVEEASHDDLGRWVTCSGCAEGVEGHLSTEDYPHSEAFGCQLGGGCLGCGGIGAVWDTTDWAAAAEDMLRADKAALSQAPEGIWKASVVSCPPHQWAHAPTVGYFLCGKCGERIEHTDPRYDQMLRTVAHASSRGTGA
jgi:hypothetical protein